MTETIGMAITLIATWLVTGGSPTGVCVAGVTYVALCNWQRSRR